MSEKDTTITNIAETIAPIISSRDIVEKFKRSIKRTPTINIALDFSNVQFISRSATHQLLTIKEEFANKWFKKKIISFINANDDVASMLRLVAASKSLPQKKKVNFNAEITNIQSIITQNRYSN